MLQQRQLSEQTRALVRGRIPNYQQLTPEDQAKAAIKVIADDFHIYCERNFVIKDKETGAVVPFVLNWEQKELVNAALKDLYDGLPVRYIILKARKVGISTVIEALCYWWTATHKHITSVIMTHDMEASNVLYEMFRMYYDYCNPQFRPDRKYNTKKDLVFDVEDQVKELYQAEGKNPPGLNSRIKTYVASPGRGRGDTPRFFHGSEVAFWEKSADVVSGALQGVPLAAETFVFLESTANGIGGYFYDEWQLAMQGESTYKPLFFAWHQHAGYELPTKKIEHYDEEEFALLEVFQRAGYPEESWDRKIAWRRAKKKDFKSDPKKFYQEYPSTDMEAFLASGRPVFDSQKLLEMERFAKSRPEPMFGIVEVDIDQGQRKYRFNQLERQVPNQNPSPLKVWALPEKGAKYTIAVDVSDGKVIEESANKENDYSVIDIMRIDGTGTKYPTVARWRGHIDPDLLGGVAFDLGMFYNEALIGVETNNQGLTTVASLKNKFYRNLYMREQTEDEQFQERTSKFGWLTNKKTKPYIINQLMTAIREGDIVDLDVIFIRECMTYVRDDQGYTNAQAGQFDDCVMAKAINLEMAHYATINVEHARKHITKTAKKDYGSTTNAFGDTANPRNKFAQAIERRKSARAARKARRSGR